jgi:uncharacterized protein YeaO (DUF488 family)
VGDRSEAGNSRNLSKSSAFSRVQVKRVYDKPAASDGCRILVDRLWPRGLTKEAAAVDLWLKDIAPSNDLRHWYGHEPGKWAEFKIRYYQELRTRPEPVRVIQKKIQEGPATLLYSSKELRLNNAVALAEFLKDDQI